MTQDERAKLVAALEAIARFMQRIGQPGDASAAERAATMGEVEIVRDVIGSLPIIPPAEERQAPNLPHPVHNLPIVKHHTTKA